MTKPRHKRSSGWAALSKRFLKGKRCAVCGGENELVAHHIIPFHVDPSKEMDVENLMCVCEGSGSLNCHFWCCHLGDWKSWNCDAVKDAAVFLEKIKNRPNQK